MRRSEANTVKSISKDFEIFKLEVTHIGNAALCGLFIEPMAYLEFGSRAGVFNLLSSRANLHLSCNPAGRSHCRLQNHEHIKHLEYLPGQSAE